MNQIHLIKDQYHCFPLLIVFLKNDVFYCLKSFLEQQNILHDSQSDFCEKRSNAHALLDMINQIKTNMDQKLYSCGIFIDIQNAFIYIVFLYWHFVFIWS